MSAGTARRSVGDKPGIPSLALAPDVVLVPAPDGSARLLHLDGAFFALDPAARALLVQVMEHGPEEASKHVAASYDVPVPRVRCDLERFLDELRAHGLIATASGGRERRRTVETLLLSWLAAPILRLTADMHSPRTRAWLLLVLARASFATVGWKRTIETWQRCLTDRPRAPVSEQTLADAREADQVIRRIAARSLLGLACKERALSCWALLRQSGVDATVTLGVSLYPLASHAWCSHGPHVLTDYVDRCEEFVPVMNYR